MSSTLSPPARSPRRLGRLCACFLLFAGASGRLAGAFNHGRSFVPTRSKARPAVSSAIGSPLRLNLAASTNAQSSSEPQVRKLATSSANGDEFNKTPSKSRRSAASAAAAALGLLSFASAAAAKKAANAAPEAALPPLVLPTVRTLALACLLPTLLGYYKSEYGVSYGYGTAVAVSSYLILSSIATAAGLPMFPALLPALKESVSLTRPLTRTSLSFHTAGVLTSLRTTLQNLRALLPASLPAFHAFSLFFYGTRLDLFLLYRELFLARFRAMRERIEQRAKKQGSRWSRTPFLISCAFLYFCMMCPLLITGRLCGGVGMACGPILKMRLSDGLVPILEQSVRLSVVAALSGFLLGAFGDLNKTVGKALGGEDALVTWGIFRFFRHPNYTGEVIGWVFSCLAGFLAVTWKAVSSGTGSRELWKGMAPYLLLSVMGATGISFVLATATTGLEYRQKEKYGDTEEYKKWVKRSWVGFKMDPAQKDPSSSESVSESDE